LTKASLVVHLNPHQQWPWLSETYRNPF
jgi:hypothetical protein